MPVVPRKVQVVETGQIFDSARAAARALGADYSDIYSCLRGERKTHKGYTFQYV